jgi:hypothetical protein
MTTLAKSILVMLTMSVTIVAGSHVLDAALKVRDKIDHRNALTCQQINEITPGGCQMQK